jgi:hypothetical protein
MDYDSSNARKYPFGLSLNQFASARIANVVANFGGRLPCQVVAVAGQIVTVSFAVNAAPFTLPQVSMPIATSEYDWLPIQIGDQGFTTTADVYMGGVSGLGGGAAGLARPGNLAALIFLPVANAAWLPPGGDPNMRVVQGPDGVLIQDLAGTCTVTVSKSAGVSVVTKNKPVQVNDGGGGTAKFDGFGFVTINCKNATVTGSSSVNLYAPTIVAAANSSAVALPVKLSNGSNSDNFMAS